MDDKRAMVNLVARLTPEEREATGGWAQIFNRTKEQEARLAIQLHLHAHALAHLTRPDGREDVRAKGFDPDAEIELVKASLARLTAEAYTLPVPADALAGVR